MRITNGRCKDASRLERLPGNWEEWVVHGITWCLGGSKEEAYGKGP